MIRKELTEGRYGNERTVNMTSKPEVEKVWLDYQARRETRKPWAHQRREVRKALREIKKAGVACG